MVLPPERQEELIAYIRYIENCEETEYEDVIDGSFMQNMDIIIDDINHMNGRNLIHPEQEDTEKSVTGPSTPRILIEALLESITLNRIMLISAVSIVAVAIIGYRLGGPQVAALILMSFSIMQAIISLLNENKTD